MKLKDSFSEILCLFVVLQDWKEHLGAKIVR
jgi:hypothetical protein